MGLKPWDLPGCLPLDPVIDTLDMEEASLGSIIFDVKGELG